MRFTAAVVTISDKGAAGERADDSGDLLERLLMGFGAGTVSRTIVPDEQEKITETLIQLCGHGADLIITNGGTGLGPRDITPRGYSRCHRAPGPRLYRDHANPVAGHHTPGHALPRRCRYPRPHTYHQLSRQPQGLRGVLRRHRARPGPRPGTAGGQGKGMRTLTVSCAVFILLHSR